MSTSFPHCCCKGRELYRLEGIVEVVETVEADIDEVKDTSSNIVIPKAHISLLVLSILCVMT